jgi:diguanylate cyclase (GGDEF)-like protein
MLSKIDLTDAFATEVAVIRPSGEIEYTNKKWNETAEHGSLDITAPWNYLDECQAAVARGCDEASEVADGLRQVLDGTSDLFVTTYACPFGGRYHWYQVLISPIYRGDARHAMAMHVDVSALQRDPLTKLPNRALFDSQLDYAVSSAEERRSQVGLLLIDMNNLKLINDQFGHAVGDCAIKAIAKCLTNVFDRHGMVARVGGDEFAIVLTDSADDVSTRRLQHEFEECLVQQSCAEHDRAPSISASFGFARWPEDGATPGALYKTADQRMYANKHKRRIA